MSQGTAAHGETDYLEPEDPTDVFPVDSMATVHHPDRRRIPLPAIPDSSIRRRELAEPYLEPTPRVPPTGWDGRPIAMISDPHQNPPSGVLSNSADRSTYLEPDESAQLDLQTNRQTADFTKGVSLTFPSKVQENEFIPKPNADCQKSGIILLPSEKSSHRSGFNPFRKWKAERDSKKRKSVLTKI